MKQTIIKNAFKFLDDIGNLSKEDVVGLFTSENTEHLKVLSKVILGVDLDTKQISPFDFAQKVLVLRKKKKSLARKLGDTLILADEKYYKFGADCAIKILYDFIDKYPSPFFQEHALNQIEYYRKIA